MSKMTLRYNEQERMLEFERRTLAGLQLQLDQATQAFRKKESEVDVATQRGIRLEMQLELSNKEIAVLKDESQKLEVCKNWLENIFIFPFSHSFNYKSNLSRSWI